MKRLMTFTKEDLERATIDSFKGSNGLEYYLYQFDKDYTLPVIGFFRPRHKYMDTNIRRFTSLEAAQVYWEDLKKRV